MPTKSVKKKKKLEPLITYTDAVEGRIKVEKAKTDEAKETLAIELTEYMLIGMAECGVVLDGFSGGVVKELILAWDDAGMIETKRGLAVAKRIREGRSTKRQVNKKK